MSGSQAHKLVNEASLVLDQLRCELEAEATDLNRIQALLTEHQSLFTAFFSEPAHHELSSDDRQIIACYLDEIKPLIELCAAGKTNIAKQLGAMRFRERVVKAYQG